jgi:hypothetical protein
MSSIRSHNEDKSSIKKCQTVLIDGDILTYRIGFASEGVGEGLCKARVDEFVLDILETFNAKDYDGYISPQDGNYRERIAVTVPYKGNRSGRKPTHYQLIREYLRSGWGFTIANGQEADDCLAIQLTYLGERGVCASIDKDLLQVPGYHYNFVKKELHHVTVQEGLRNFYLQVLTGDRVDNVVGIRGIGPVKAAKLLECCDTGEDLFRRCVECYEGDYGRVIENCRLLWLRRHEEQDWKGTLNENLFSESEREKIAAACKG